MSLKELLGFSKKPGFIIGQKQPTYTNKLSYDDLINAESALGRTLFGPIPIGHQREFFKHKDNVWIWYESWLDEAGKEQTITIRYEVCPAGVYKKVAGSGYKKLEGAELNNFRMAAKNYLNLVKTKLYC
jgi:hypothetical protein